MSALSDFWSNFVTTPTYKVIRTALKTFLATAIGLVVAQGVGVLDPATGQWKGVLTAAFSAAVMVIANALNPSYTDYGVGMVKEEE